MNKNKLIRCLTVLTQYQWRHQDLLRGGAKMEIMSWGTHGMPGAAAAR